MSMIECSNLLGKCDAGYMFRVLRAKSGSRLRVVGNVYDRVF